MTGQAFTHSQYKLNSVKIERPGKFPGLLSYSVRTRLRVFISSSVRVIPFSIFSSFQRRKSHTGGLPLKEMRLSSFVVSLSRLRTATRSTMSKVNIRRFPPPPRKNSRLNASEPVGNSGFSVLQSVNFYAISLCNPFASALKLALNASSLSSSGFIVRL